MESEIDISGDPAKLTLYHRWLSSCSARLRIALNLLHLSYTYVLVPTTNDEQDQLLDYQNLNPNRSVPTLVLERGSNNKRTIIGQSWAALEWLCETPQLFFSSSASSLLPQDPMARARVRELCMIIVADTQPMTTTRVGEEVDKLGGKMAEWRRFWHRRGLEVYNETMKNGPEGIRAGKYSVGDEVTLADCVLVPAVWKCEQAEMGPEVWGEDLQVLKGVYTRLMGLEEVRRARWVSQGDKAVPAG